MSRVTLSEPASYTAMGRGCCGLCRGVSLLPEPGSCSGTALPGSLTLWDSPLSTGNYEVSIKFNDEHIPESPYVVPVIAPSDDARRLTVLSLQVRRKETSISLATA